MVINLCLPQFHPRVACNKISADGYEVENLISDDLSKRNRGFRCEYFIRPPVHVTITFPCSTEICRINIDTSHGGQHHFSGIDLYTSSSSTKSSWSAHDPNQAGLVVPDKELFTLVGKVLLKNQSKVTFNNRAFKPRHPFHQFDHVMSYHGSSCQELWNKGPSSLAGVTSLKICITHIAGGAPCCIKRVEVWGHPAKTCPKEIVESLYQIACLSLPHDSAQQQQQPSLPMDSSHMLSSTLENIQRSPSELATILHNVPEEFLDPITLDIMTFPMLLPSGKVIDQSTLDKCNQSEATWGRLPSDPFTGVPFNQHSQAVPHPSLKVRIDYFLLQHRMPGSNILGRTQIGPFVTPSAVALSSMKRKVEWMEDSDNDGDNVDTYFSAVSGFNSSASDFSAKKLKTENDCSQSNMDCSTSNSDAASHEQRLTQSLDYALTTTLGSMPSYTARFVKGHQLGASGESGGGTSAWSTIPEFNRCAEGQGCSSCGRIFSAYCKTEPVYQLSCGHLMCRPCLAEKQKSLSILCNNCNRSVATRDVQRVHL
ncbi:RING finger protein 37 [Xenopus tropicalis]|uniref:RING finger protein 37 n=1 Tax=Xenopus tropicalis TaxID=8364 RepID=Q6DFT1_XENTR|eukprot:NP_001005006.1 RING finger protein 37 [Xenopus tropicalis]